MRASADDAIATLADWLNLYAGATISINELARRTGLAWATVKKYVDVIGRLQHTAPILRVSDDGIQVLHPGAAFQETIENPLARGALAVWFSHHRDQEASQALDEDPQFLDSLHTLRDMAFIEGTGTQTRLTPAGLSFAHSLYGDIIRYGEDANATGPSTDGPDETDASMARGVVHQGGEWREPVTGTRVMAA